MVLFFVKKQKAAPHTSQDSLHSSDNLNVVMVSYLAAVETFERHGFAWDYVKLGGHRLRVGDALRVDALADALDALREFHGAFFLYLIVADDVEVGSGGDEGNLVDFLVLKKLVGNLDDGLLAKLLGIQVVANCYGRVDAVESKYLHYLEEVFGWDVVYYRAVLYRAYFQFFLFHFRKHKSVFVTLLTQNQCFKPSTYEITA